MKISHIGTEPESRCNMNRLSRLSRIEAEEALRTVMDDVENVSSELTLLRVEADRAINDAKVDILTKKEFYAKKIELLKMERFALESIKNKY